MNRILGLLLVVVATLTVQSCISNRIVEADKTNPPVLFTMPTGSQSHPSIIRLETPDGFFYCTGSVIDANYAITAAHCVTNSIGGVKSDPIDIYDKYDNKVTTAVAVAADSLRDVAFIKGDFNEFQVAQADFRGTNVKAGMHMVSCGFPSGQFYEFCIELVHSGNYNFRYRTIGGPIFKGMSGGPVYEKDSGVIVGVNSAVDENNVIISPLVGVLEVLGLE